MIQLTILLSLIAFTPYNSAAELPLTGTPIELVEIQNNRDSFIYKTIPQLKKGPVSSDFSIFHHFCLLASCNAITSTAYNAAETYFHQIIIQEKDHILHFYASSSDGERLATEV